MRLAVLRLSPFRLLYAIRMSFLSRNVQAHDFEKGSIVKAVLYHLHPSTPSALI